MKTRLKPLLSSAALALFIACSGCLLRSPPHSQYRPIHQYASACDAVKVAADLGTNSADLNLPDDGGWTPLHWASSHCCTNVVGLLLGKGANVNCKANGGEMPLHIAAQEGCSDAVIMLLNKGAKINAQDSEGRTPLKRAKDWEQPAIAELLRQRGGIE